MTSREWDAAAYDRLSHPQLQWGQRVLKSLHLRGDETVLDAGCGSGKLTGLLLQHLSHGRVIGLDVSRNMLQVARQNLASQFGARVQFVAADVLHLPFHLAFDGVFSTASFHWVHDHDALFCSIFHVLRAGGWLHAQCGGGPNLARLRDHIRSIAEAPAFSRWLRDFAEPWFFSDDTGAAQRLRSAGFIEVETGLEPAPFYVAGGQQFQDYLRTFVVHRYLEHLPNDELRRAFIEEITKASAADNPPWTLDYWRLNLRARKP